MFDGNRFYLGKLCKNNHEHENSGKSLRRKNNRNCINCQKINVKNWDKNHREQRKKYRDNHKDEHDIYKKEYDNKEHNKIRRRNVKNKYLKERRLSDIKFKILDNLRRRLRSAIYGSYKSKHTLELLGCSIEFLKEHLSQKFYNNPETNEPMTFENYGLWHIDHKIPCSVFDLTDPLQQEICFGFNNLQPLWGKDNLKKSDKLY